MRTFLLVALFITIFAISPHALAQTSQTSFVPLAPIPGLTQGVTADTAGLANFFNNLYKYLVGLSAILAVIMIIWGGLEYSTQDSVSKKSDGKERIYQAIFGLVLVLSPVLVFSIINPSILNLSINLDPLKTISGPNNGGPGSGPGTTFCSGQTTTNCTPLPPVAGGQVQMRVPGWWCYEIVPQGANKYYCALNQTDCFNDWSDNDPNAARQAVPGTQCTQTPGTPPPPPVGTPTRCQIISGTPGLLQIAACPSLSDATDWGKNCTNGALATTQKENPANGIVTTIITCSVQKNYVFIDTGRTTYAIINRLQPLVSTAENQNNAADAMSFASICGTANLGLQTCISKDPLVSRATPCNLTGANAATSWKCYSEKLTCEDAATINPYCASNPSWTPFQ